MHNNDLSGLEEAIGYKFKDISLLELAVTHSSFAHETGKGAVGTYNERIEYLGDAVLELISSEYLYLNYPKKPEGELTKTRASLVCEYSLAICAREIKLGSYIKLSKGEDKTGGRKRDSILSDAFESVLGAMYLDGGIEVVKRFLYKVLLTDIENKVLFNDAKTTLQEMVQAKKGYTYSYEIIDESGPDHAKVFTSVVKINGEVAGTGTGRTKKAADQHAAYDAIIKLKDKDF